MSKSIKVSVLVPIYNRHQFIEQMLECLTAQTLKEIEFLIVDDASTDKSFELLQQKTAGDARFKIMQMAQNSGPSACRNKALTSVKGQYIGFFDSDDTIPADYFASLYQQAEDAAADIVYTVYNEQKHVVGEVNSLEEKLRVLRNGSLWDKLYRTDLVRQNGIKFDEGLYTADNVFVVTAFYLAQKSVLTSTPVYQYKLHADSIGKDKKKTLKRKRDIMTVCTILLNFAKQKAWTEAQILSLRRFLAKSFDCYQKDKKFRAELAKVLDLDLKKENLTMNNVEKHSRTVKLFFFLPIYGWKQRGGKKSWKILGLPVFTRRKMSNGITTKYYILGIPVMKVSKKYV